MAKAEMIIKIVEMCIPLIEEFGKDILPLIEKLVGELAKLKQGK